MNSYKFSSEYRKFSEIVLENNSVFFYVLSSEERSFLGVEFEKMACKDVEFIEIIDNGNDQISVKHGSKIYLLRSSDDLTAFFTPFYNKVIYWDVSGMGIRIAAPLLKCSVELFKQGLICDLHVVYAEPAVYDIKKFREEGVFNDLSEQINGIEPLPGFANIFPDGSEEFIFVVLLGFEGGRFTHIVDNIQPYGTKLIPVIGVPGFRPEYPFVAYWGNRRTMSDSNSWRDVQFISANSISEVFHRLIRIGADNPNKKLKIAPIGTKPHAIGAILFAIYSGLSVELVYDNPIRKKKRTEGIGKVLICNVARLIMEV